VPDEVAYVFENLGKFWATGLNICKWYDLTVKERERISNNSVQTDSIRKIYQRCEQDEARFKFWDFLADWDDTRFVKLSKHDFIKSKEKNETRQDKFSLILWKYHTNFSSQFLRVNESLKFTKWLD